MITKPINHFICNFASALQPKIFSFSSFSPLQFQSQGASPSIRPIATLPQHLPRLNGLINLSIKITSATVYLTLVSTVSVSRSFPPPSSNPESTERIGDDRETLTPKSSVSSMLWVLTGYWIRGFGIGESMDERPALRNAVTQKLEKETSSLLNKGSKRWQAGMTESFSRSLHLQVPFCIIYTSPILVLWKSTTRRSLDLKLKNLDLIGIEMVMIAITTLILLFLSRLVLGSS